MTNIVRKCIAWNEARYDRVYDYNLASKLLIEETLELFQAENDSDRLDAVGDIVFVAIGILWKLGVSPEHIEDILGVNNLYFAGDGAEIEKINVVIDNVQSFLFDTLSEDLEAAYPGIALTLYSLFIVALGTLHGMRLQHRFYDVVDAICESNNTKELKGKTDPTVKANLVKGEGFVPPTDALLRILIEEGRA